MLDNLRVRVLLGGLCAKANTPIHTIVLARGAWADASGWQGVYGILVRDGYSMVQEPETSFKEDVTATKRVLALRNGPCILVAHSYGGAVITEAELIPQSLD